MFAPTLKKEIIKGALVSSLAKNAGWSTLESLKKEVQLKELSSCRMSYKHPCKQILLLKKWLK